MNPSKLDSINTMKLSNEMESFMISRSPRDTLNWTLSFTINFAEKVYIIDDDNNTDDKIMLGYYSIEDMQLLIENILLPFIRLTFNCRIENVSQNNNENFYFKIIK